MKNIDDYVILSKICSIEHVSIYRCEDMDKNKYIIHLYNALDNKIIQTFYNSLKINLQICHETLPNLLQYGITNEYLYLLTEQFDGQSLSEYLSKHRVDDFATFVKILTQILDVIELLIKYNYKGVLLNLGSILINNKNEIKILNFEHINSSIGYKSSKLLGDYYNHFNKISPYDNSNMILLLLFQVLFGKIPKLKIEEGIYHYIQQNEILKNEEKQSEFPNCYLPIFQELFQLRNKIINTSTLRNKFVQVTSKIDAENILIIKIGNIYSSAFDVINLRYDNNFEHILEFNDCGVILCDTSGIIEKIDVINRHSKILYRSSLSAFAVIQNGTIIVAVDFISGIQLWSIKDLRLISIINENNIRINDIDSYNKESIFSYCGYSVNKRIYDEEDGSEDLTNDCEGAVVIYSLVNNKIINRLKINNFDQLVLMARFNPVDGSLLCNTNEGVLTLYSSVDMSKIKTIKHEHSELTTIVFNNNGKLIACADSEGFLSIISSENEKLSKKIKGHKKLISSIVFSPDGKYLVSGSWDKSIKFWDTETLSLVSSIDGLTDSVSSIVFSEEGDSIIVAFGEKLIKRWEYEKKRRINIQGSKQLEEEERIKNENKWDIATLADFLGYDGDTDGLSEDYLWDITGH